jgi:hypothetical protein
MIEHISEERILELVSDPHTASRVEDSHFEDCGQCFRKFVERVRELERQRRDSIVIS